MSSQQHNGSGKKLTEALELLNEAAREKKNEIRNLISDRASAIQGAMKDAVQGAVTEGKEHLKTAEHQVRDVFQEGEEKLEKTVRAADKAVRKSPWKFIGAAALGALTFGFLLGNSKKDK